MYESNEVDGRTCTESEKLNESLTAGTAGTVFNCIPILSPSVYESFIVYPKETPNDNPSARLRESPYAFEPPLKVEIVSVNTSTSSNN